MARATPVWTLLAAFGRPCPPGCPRLLRVSFCYLGLWLLPCLATGLWEEQIHFKSAESCCQATVWQKAAWWVREEWRIPALDPGAGSGLCFPAPLPAILPLSLLAGGEITVGVTCRWEMCLPVASLQSPEPSALQAWGAPSVPSAPQRCLLAPGQVC